MSKSVGNIVDPNALIDTFGVDQVRYFLLREVPFGQDGSYSEDAIITRINADLANELGNLAQRSLSMVAKNLDGVVPDARRIHRRGHRAARRRRRAAGAGARRIRQPGNASGAGSDLADARRGQPVLLGAGAVGVAQERVAGRPGALRDRAVHDLRGGADRGAAGSAGDAGSAGKLLDLLGQPPDQRSFAASAHGWSPARRCRRPPVSFRATKLTEFLSPSSEYGPPRARRRLGARPHVRRVRCHPASG